MRNSQLFSFLIVFLVSCDQKNETDMSDTDGSSGPRITRAKRPAREKIPSRMDELKVELQMALEHKVPEAREQSLAKLVRESIGSAPEIASEAFQKLPVDCEERMKTIRFLADIYARNNPSEALTWAATLGSAQETQVAREVISVILAATDPKGAAMVLLETGKTIHELNEPATEVLSNWAAETPGEAVAWAFKQAPGGCRNMAIHTVLSQWIQVDSKAAFSWTASLENPSVKNEAVSVLAYALSEQPESSHEALLETADSELRTLLQQQFDQVIPQPVEE